MKRLVRYCNSTHFSLFVRQASSLLLFYYSTLYVGAVNVSSASGALVGLVVASMNPRMNN